MARISGVDLPREKRVEIGLTYIYGIGVASSRRILSEANETGFYYRARIDLPLLFTGLIKMNNIRDKNKVIIAINIIVLLGKASVISAENRTNK